MRVVVDGAVVMDSSHPPEAFQQLTAVFVSQGSSATIRFENDSPDGDNSFFSFCLLQNDQKCPNDMLN